MPDPILILEAMSAAAATAAALILVCAWPWQNPRAALASVGAVLGVGLGFFAGCWLLGVRPDWPPRQDQDRLLLILWPAVMGVELVAAFAGALQWLVWLLRTIVAASAARVLLHSTIYLTELTGPGSREWTPVQTGLILGAMAIALAGGWASLVHLARRTVAPVFQPDKPNVVNGRGSSVLLAVAVACAGTAITVMLTGYATGGELGLPLASALAGGTAALWFLKQSRPAEGMLGLGIVGLFALLVMGRFFGELPNRYAILLFLSTFMGWFPELPYICRLWPRLRGVLRVALVAVPVAAVLMLAQQKFVRDSDQTAPGTGEPTIEDYMHFGK
jgi:hypothetical protein